MKKAPIIFVILLLAVAGAGYWMFLRPHAMGGPPKFATPVEVALVAAEPLKDTLSAVGTLKSNESVMMRPEIQGRVEKIHFNEGQVAKKGALLISLDASIYDAEVKQAQANLRLAQLSYERARKLTKSGATSQSRLDQARADLGVAQAQRDVAITHRDKTRILAPFDGTVGLRNVSPGDVVNAGQDLVHFQSNNPMKVEFTLPENASEKVQVGQMLSITIDALPNQTFEGKVYAVDPQIDLQGRSLTVRAMVANDNNVLRAGFFAQVQLVLGEKSNALTVPETAIVPQGGMTGVFVVGADNKVELRPVKIGTRFDAKVELLEGVKAVEKVVVAGHLKLYPGAEVMVMDKAAAPAAAPAAPAAEKAEEKAPAAEAPAAESTEKAPEALDLKTNDKPAE